MAVLFRYGSGLLGRGRQSSQDAALLGGARLTTALAQFLELLLQGPQLPDAPGDMPDVFIEQGIDIPMVIAWRPPTLTPSLPSTSWRPRAHSK